MKLPENLRALRFQLYHAFENQVTFLLAPIVPRDRLERRLRPPVLIPYYHLVSDERVGHVIHLFSYRNTDQFKADLDFFLKYYRPIDLADLLAAVRSGRPLKEKAVLLTFDDGFREIHDVVAPILKQKGVPAIFFITAAFLDNQTLGYRHQASLLVERMHQLNPTPRTVKEVSRVLGCANGSRGSLVKKLVSRDGMDSKTLDGVASVLEVSFKQYLSDVQPYLTTVQLNDLVREGFHIGGHSINHFPYRTLTPSEQITQTSESTRTLRQAFGLDYSVFAFPYSDAGIRASFFEALDARIDLFFGTSAFSSDRISKIVQRFWMEDTSAPADTILNRLYIRHHVRELFGLNKAKR